MSFITIFLREYVGDVVSTWYVLYVDEFLLYVFSNCIISKLYVSNCSCCLIFAPLDTRRVIVEDVDGFGEKFFGKS